MDRRLRRPFRCLSKALSYSSLKLRKTVFIVAYAEVRGGKSKIVAYVEEPSFRASLCGDSWRDISLKYISLGRGRTVVQGGVYRSLVSDGMNGILAKLGAQGRLRTVKGYKPFLMNVPEVQHADPVCEEVCKEMAAALGVEEEVAKHEWASEKKGAQVYSKLDKLADLTADLEERQVPAEEWLMLLLEEYLSQPNINGDVVKSRPVGIDALPHFNIKDTSSGYDTRDLKSNVPCPGHKSKRGNALWAAQKFRESCAGVRIQGQEGVPPQVVGIFSKANEILPLEKAQRKIFPGSTENYVAAKCLMAEAYHTPINPFTGRARNLKMNGNAGMIMLMRLCPELDWDTPGKGRSNVEKAWEILEAEDSLEENDKSSWEYLIAPQLKLIYVMIASLTMDLTGNENYILPFADVMALFLCPLIALEDAYVLPAPYQMPSGLTDTLDANTTINRMMSRSFKHYIYDHGTAEDAKTAQMVDASAWYQGDDSLERNATYSIGVSKAEWLDKKWGTQSKSKTGNYKQCAFLQRKLAKTGNGVPQLLYSSERAKVKMCFARADARRQADAIASLVLSTGDADLAAAARPFHRRLMEHIKIPLTGSEGGVVGAEFLNPGVLRSYWNLTSTAMRDICTAHKMEYDTKMHPDQYDFIYKEALEKRRTGMNAQTHDHSRRNTANRTGPR